MAMMSAMMLPDGKHLKDFYSKKQWAFVQQRLAEKLGPMADSYHRMKPFLVLGALNEAAMPKDRPEVLDGYLLKAAKDRGNNVIGLETVGEQLRTVDAIPVKDQAAMLLDHLRSDRQAAEYEALMNAYVKQDLDGLMDLAARSGRMPRALDKSVRVERNARMAHRMDSLLRVGGASLFLIGAAHLPGDDGVIEKLRAMGYMVDPMPLDPDPAPAAAHPPAILLEQGMHYTDSLHGFSVDMPNGKIDHPDLPGVIWTVMAEGKSTLVAVAELPPPVDGQTLDEWLAQQLGGVQMRSEVITMNGCDGRRIFFDAPLNGMAMLALQCQPRLMTVTVRAVGDEAAKVAGQVLDSFRLIGDRER
jgi:hypothetical protein